MLISLSITRIAECVCARVALDSAKRNFELPLLPGASGNPQLRGLIAETTAELIDALGRKVSGTNARRIKPETDDIIVLEYNAAHHQGVLVNARINLETAVVGRVLAALSADSDTVASRWYASVARVATATARLRG